MRTDIVERSNRAFERVGLWSYDHRWFVLFACVAALALMTTMAAGVRFDNGLDSWFNPHDPVFEAYLDYRDEFGSDEVSYIVYEAPDAEHGPWNLDVMRKIASLTEALETEVPFVDEVNSLVNAELILPIPDGIEVMDMVEEFPRDQAELLQRRDAFMDKPMYLGGLISKDARYGGIVVEMTRSSTDSVDRLMFDPEGGDGLDNFYPQASYFRIEEILARPEYDGLVFHHTGDTALNAVMNTVSARESVNLAIATFFVVACVLYFFLRGFVGVVGPLSVVLLAILVTVGTIRAMGFELGFLFTMIPTLLTAVGVANAVHLISEFRAFETELGDPRAAVGRTMYLVATPCLLTSLTTAAGFAAMTVSPIAAIAELGLYSAVGVLAAFVLSVTLLMVFLSFIRPRAGTIGDADAIVRARGGHRMQRALVAVGEFDVRHRRGILCAAFGIIVFSLAGALQLRVDSNFLNDFDASMPVRQATELLDEVMGGGMSLVYLFDSGKEEGVKDPVVLRDIERVAKASFRGDDLVKKSYAITDYLLDINKTFHDGDDGYFRLPESRELVGQYLLLYEMSGGEDAGDFLSGDFSRAPLEIRVRGTVDSSRVAELAAHLDEYMRQEPLEGSTVRMTGVGALWVQLMEYITRSQIQGFLLAFVAIAVMLCIVFRSVKVGLIAMLPNLCPVLLTLGAMGWMDVSLDYVRMLVAPVAIGIAVDDTIHHVTRFRHEFERYGNYATALIATMRDVGRALLATSVILVAGFSVYGASELNAMQTFGILLGTTIVTALVADFLLMPALVLTLEPFGPEHDPQ